MPRLRRSDPESPGWSRRRRGRGFSYTDEHGSPLDPVQRQRAEDLVIPPAWREVWICPDPAGHLQATGTDDAGRRQYLYHPAWRERREDAKFTRIRAAAGRLGTARRRVSDDLAREGMPLARACATAVRLLDVGYFRVGGDAYADAHGSFGLTTLRRSHVRRHGSDLVFSYTGKSGVAHTIRVDDAAAVAALETMRRRRGGSDRLLVHKVRGRWVDLRADDVNDYLRELFDGELTAKDFRTWHGTVIAAEVLALTDEPGGSEASRRRAVAQAAREVAGYLGNTPAVARASYIDPAVVEAYREGRTIVATASRRHRSPERRQADLERAVLDLLD